jgi:TatD DNase family protein
VTSEPTRARGEDGGSRRDRSRPPLPEPLPVPVADSHCHLDIADGPADEAWLDVDRALELAAQAGVPRVVQIGCELLGARWAVDVANRYDAVVAAVALHPNEAPRLGEDLEASLVEIDALAAGERVRAVGETGLDYYRTGEEGRETQHLSFRAHIEMAKRHGKALVIHDRDAHDDVLRVLADAGPPDRVVFHCFSGDADMARHCVERGWWLSFAGTVTFKNAQPLREALAVTPLENLLVETDAPYLTPMPYRGRPNASYLVPLTLRAMAQVKDVPVEDLATAVAANTERAFGAW